MYHSHYTQAQRPQYLQLLAQAEELLPQALINADALRTVIRAASAVRGSDAQLSRMKHPITPQQYTTLISLIRTSRTYVNNFWPEASTTPLPALGGSPAKPKVVVNPTSQPPKQPIPHSTPTSPALSGFPAKPKVVVNPVIPTPQPSTANCQLPTPIQHLDQYLPLLSPKLQHQAAVLQQKYAALNDAHETLSRLTRQALSPSSPSPASSPAVGGSPANTPPTALGDSAAKPTPISLSLRRELSYYAQQVDHLVRVIDTFWLQVHAERQALEGKPVTPEYKAYLDQLAAKFPMEEPLRTWGEYTKEEIEAMANYTAPPASGGSTVSALHPTLQALGCTIDELTQARIIRDKKLLRVKPPQKVTERAKSLRIQAMEELHAWGHYIEKAQKECLEKMGIEVPEDYLSPFLTMTEEERRDRKRAHDRANYHRNKPLAVKLGIAKKQKEDQKNDNPYKPNS